MTCKFKNGSSCLDNDENFIKLESYLVNEARPASYSIHKLDKNFKNIEWLKKSLSFDLQKPASIKVKLIFIPNKKIFTLEFKKQNKFIKIKVEMGRLSNITDQVGYYAFDNLELLRLNEGKFFMVWFFTLP
jgi:hypothetical protein